ncbi:MAG: hypothetical protein NT074_00425 [Methanomicrobiales archaeon]|nr:hypothetical protein [Methanomicrobiales archaeon]
MGTSVSRRAIDRSSASGLNWCVLGDGTPVRTSPCSRTGAKRGPETKGGIAI